MILILVILFTVAAVYASFHIASQKTSVAPKEEPSGETPAEQMVQEAPPASHPKMMDLKGLLDEVRRMNVEDRKKTVRKPERKTMPKPKPVVPHPQTGNRQESYIQRQVTPNRQPGSALLEVPNWEDRLHEVRIYQHEVRGTFWMAVKYRGLYLPNKRISTEEYNLYHETPFEAIHLVAKYYEEEILEIIKEGDNVESTYQAGENLEMVVLKPLSFSGYGHLVNFCNYLLRTDRHQKWTNELTPVCNMAFQRNAQKIYKMGNLNNRILTRDILVRDAMKGRSDKQVDHLCMQVVELHSITDEYIEVDDKQCLNLFKEYIHRCERQRNHREVLAFIEHSDGNDRPYHIHMLCRRIDNRKQDGT